MYVKLAEQEGLMIEFTSYRSQAATDYHSVRCDVQSPDGRANAAQNIARLGNSILGSGEHTVGYKLIAEISYTLMKRQPRSNLVILR